MSILRAPRPKTNWYRLHKVISEDERLSWAARGLLIFLLGKPDNWRVSVEHLRKQTIHARIATGRNGVYALLRELEAVGYVEHRQIRTADGRLGAVDYVIREKPHPSDRDAVPHTTDRDLEPHTSDRDVEPHTFDRDVEPHTSDRDAVPHPSAPYAAEPLPVEKTLARIERTTRQGESTRNDPLKANARARTWGLSAAEAKDLVIGQRVEAKRVRAEEDAQWAREHFPP